MITLLKSQEKTVMKSNLNFQWDKREERFIKKQSGKKSSEHSIKDVTIYLDYLAEISPEQYDHIDNKATDAKFYL